MDKITFKQYIDDTLFEAPLPDEWRDSGVYDGRQSFAKRIKYAVERSKKIGAGSSRVAFEIEYQGRPTVLKIAKNPKGLAQNEAESQILNDYYFTGLGISIPMIDYDEDNDPPVWIHLEKAEKAKDSDFKRVAGGTLQQVMVKACQLAGKHRDLGWQGNVDVSHIDDENELVNGLMNYVGNYDVPVGDLFRLANWGIYKGDPVIVDVGLNSEVSRQHYGMR